ncbi:MAG: transcription antitermination factor NusB [Actinomycetota bacterium]
MTNSRQFSARRVALEALVRIERDGAFANLVLGPILERSGLSQEDRAFVTMLVYGTTRMKRACDAVVDRFIAKEPDATTRQVLRLGAYQIVFSDVPDHAAVDETVAVAPLRSRGFVNAVLRRVAATPMQWPNDMVKMSYPDWIVHRLASEMDASDLASTLETMNQPAPVTKRLDGYVQDVASQDVVRSVGACRSETIVDVCAGPGGKATGLAATGAHVIAADISPVRAGLVKVNSISTHHPLAVLVADARQLPLLDACADRVLVDAPCSGLGVLRRRADARWRIQESDIADLAAIQASILTEAARLVRRGGVLVFSVCTLTAQESIDHEVPHGFDVVSRDGDGDLPALGEHWEPFGHGARVLPHRIDSDGMVLLRYRRSV